MADITMIRIKHVHGEVATIIKQNKSSVRIKLERTGVEQTVSMTQLHSKWREHND